MVQARLASICFLIMLAFGLVSATTDRGLQATNSAAAAVLWKPILVEAPTRLRTLRGVNAATAAQTVASTKRCYTICPTCVCAKTEALNCCSQEKSNGYADCVMGNESQLCKTNRAVNACCV